MSEFIYIYIYWFLYNYHKLAIIVEIGSHDKLPLVKDSRNLVLIKLGAVTLGQMIK